MKILFFVLGFIACNRWKTNVDDVYVGLVVWAFLWLLLDCIWWLVGEAWKNYKIIRNEIRRYSVNS